VTAWENILNCRAMTFCWPPTARRGPPSKNCADAAFNFPLVEAPGCCKLTFTPEMYLKINLHIFATAISLRILGHKISEILAEDETIDTFVRST
jgi:hypothetical protein